MANISEKLDGMTIAEARAHRKAFCNDLNTLIAEKVAALESETGMRVGNDLFVNVNHGPNDKVVVMTGFKIVI